MQWALNMYNIHLQSIFTKRLLMFIKIYVLNKLNLKKRR